MKFLKIGKPLFRKILLFTLLFVIFLVAVVFFCNRIIVKQSQNFIYKNVADIPARKVGLLLGTTKALSNGLPNQYFYYRVKAAVDLYKAKKIEYILVSGDNHVNNYNEPEDLKAELLKNGIPDSVIYCDFAGFRTFDSVIRCKEIFGQQQFTIISQQFHCERAIYIASRYGLQTCGYVATDVEKFEGFKTKVRELFARVKVFIDIFTNKQPRFLGEKITIGK